MSTQNSLEEVQVNLSTSAHSTEANITNANYAPLSGRQLLIGFLAQLESVSRGDVIGFCTPGNGAGRLYCHMQQSAMQPSVVFSQPQYANEPGE